MVYGLWDEPAAGNWCGRLLASSLLSDSVTPLQVHVHSHVLEAWETGRCPQQADTNASSFSVAAKADAVVMPSLPGSESGPHRAHLEG